jgi:hypothetical protein
VVVGSWRFEMLAELPSFFWFTLTVVLIVAIYYVWGRKLGDGSPKVKVVELSKTEPQAGTMDP